MKKFALIAALALLPIISLPHGALAGDDGKQPVVPAPTPEEKGPPLPLHTIEGTGGILITPTAYLTNPSERWLGFLGFPAISTSYVKANSKNVESFVVTETIAKRVELGFAASRFGTGDFNKAVLGNAGAAITRDDVFLYNANVRVAIINDGDFGIPFLPALTAGAQFKFNEGIATINREAGYALTHVGYRSSDGVDFPITLSKTLKGSWTLNRPLLLSAGVRFSKASQLGYTGFGSSYSPTAEANAAYSITDWLWLAGEFRQKRDPYSSGVALPSGAQLVRPEQNWWDIGVAFVLNKNATLTAGYGNFGNLLNTVERKAFALQLKYEF
jgi:hypothetical protein